MVDAFRQNCGFAGRSPESPDIFSLTEGLNGLIEWDARGQDADLALCGNADLLVTPEMSRACFSQPIWGRGGHLLPLECPAWCADQLKALVP